MGKWSALNRGVKLAKNDSIVLVDADTVVEEGAIGILSRRLDECDAVAGNLQVDGKGSLIGRIQAQEHLRISMFRGAEGSVETLSGPLAAFRKETLEKDPFKDSLVEDFEHTARIRKWGAKICYEPRARAYTSMPSGWGGYMRQRKRWAIGTLGEMRRGKMPLSSLFKGYCISVLDVAVLPVALLYGRYDAIFSLFMIEALVQSLGSYKERSVVTLGNIFFLPILVFLALMHLYLSIFAHLNIRNGNENV